MNCVEWEEKVALRAGGDLADAEAAAVEQHLGECPGCQVMWSGLRDDLAVLKSAHSELPAAAHFTAVRSRVMAELERPARPWWKLCWVYGFAAVAAALVLLATWPRGPVPTAPRILASIPAAPLVIAPVQDAATAPSRSRLRSESRVIASNFREPLTIKLQTADPNIVIYWIAN